MRSFSTTALVALWLTGCSSPPPPAAPAPPKSCEATRPKLVVAASQQVNAGPDGAGLPVQVRLYQLKSEARLLNAFFEEIWKQDTEALGEDLVRMREITVFPGKSQELELDQQPESRVLSAVALFREPRGRDWFLNYDLAEPKEEPPCPPAEPRISIWLDRMKIQDGEGRIETSEAQPAAEGSAGASGDAPENGGN